MNLIFRKTRNIYNRLKNGFQVAAFPEKFYLYPKEPYLYHNLSYSQEGEDMIISRFFEGKKQGFYVDVGAHHPQRFSNTYRFYLQGWRGINIDAMPGSMEIFNKIRANDINLEISISDCNQILTYYEFNEPALNGFCADISI
ncbi:FkbM family methyltransferase, partial [Symplocastrum sp. BBK-W-15]|nr:FkbM family methyltransferase [Limnofasciculus baicalensis BBK-W-15]